ncbi:DUF1836 domain-containing protein [Weissella minor]|uniref:DUF1836 domain-containing protein n=1 Tax=Weissella minor TaxID=1620 RepID=UPI001BB09576|nr:DUF1836 domain-containing protein [Weissella minor]MBS0949425.1 DUF1836 domain-containing protein [Weissella minor]
MDTANWNEFRLPRWEELTNLSLYLDQVVELTTEALAEIMPSHEKKVLTSSMLNNYVKQSLMPAPIKKRYSKQHIAFLIVITLMKQTFSLSEIETTLNLALKETSLKEFYNEFVQQQEQSLAFVSQNMQATESDVENPNRLIQAVTLAIATSLYSKQLIEKTQLDVAE